MLSHYTLSSSLTVLIMSYGVQQGKAKAISMASTLVPMQAGNKSSMYSGIQDGTRLDRP